MPDPNPLRTHPIQERQSKVRREQMAPAPTPLAGFLERLPGLLAADDLREVVSGIADAYRHGRPVLVSFGAHVVKCGLGPVLIELMRPRGDGRGIVTALATNGATLIHDSELALFGHTSEDVARGLREGTFGMAEETPAFLNGAIRTGVRSGLGIGEAVGQALLEASAPYAAQSVLAQAALHAVPCSVHVAIGTDIIHMHPSADGAATGEGTLRDFHRLAALVGDLSGGVLLNLGSAVIMPEVLLKAFGIAANQGRRLDGCLTVDMDMVRHYRSATQIVERIRHLGGRGLAITGHHEIMLPVLAGLVLAEVEGASMG